MSPTIKMCFDFRIEDEAQIKSDCIISKDNIASPNKGRTRSGSNSTEMAVDQLQASEKLIAGNLKAVMPKVQNINELCSF